MIQFEISAGSRLRDPRRPRLFLGIASLGLALISVGGLLASGDSVRSFFYSSAEPSAELTGPQPQVLVDEAVAAPGLTSQTGANADAEPQLGRDVRPTTRLASTVSSSRSVVPAVESTQQDLPGADPAILDAIEEAKRAIASCQARLEEVRDYTCVFYKRERLADGRMTSQHILEMKARTSPRSVYFKFVQPKAGREAIWVDGQHKNKALVHDVGLGKLLVGTLRLDPTSAMAMENCRHPITSAGLDHLIQEVATRWEAELHPGEAEVTIHRNTQVGDRPCTLIESVHPEPHPDYLFHRVNLYIDKELNLPIRFEAYDWPSQPGGLPELVEEYSYMDLKLNTGLDDRDFDPGNRAYSFGRF